MPVTEYLESSRQYHIARSIQQDTNHLLNFLSVISIHVYSTVESNRKRLFVGYKRKRYKYYPNIISYFVRELYNKKLNFFIIILFPSLQYFNQDNYTFLFNLCTTFLNIEMPVSSKQSLTKCWSRIHSKWVVLRYIHFWHLQIFWKAQSLSYRVTKMLH